MELGAASVVIATGLATGVSFLGMAWKSDDMVSKELREDLSLWLLCIEPEKVGSSIHRWPAHFAALFDRVFGEKHLSWRCALRSCIASVLAVVLCTLVFSQVAVWEWTVTSREFGLSQTLRVVGLIALVFNLLPDYVSLLETRLVIGKLKAARSILSQVAWLLADFVATLCIFTLGFVAVFTWLGNDVATSVRNLVDVVTLSGSGEIELRFLAIPFWTTFFTSVWVWLYFLGQFLMRLANPIRKTIDVLKYALPVEQRPLRAVGEVMAVTACLAYWSLMVPLSVFGVGRVTDYLEPKMVVVPSGAFVMGSTEWDYERPQHRVRISSFAMSKYEITFEEYDRFAEATGRAKPNDSHWGRGRRPVGVSWKDARNYAAWLSELSGKRYRLPSEAEWEYAARGGKETRYWWGNDMVQGKANCDGCGSQWDGKQTAPVGSFQPNPFGLYDTAGNVGEWVRDCLHKNYDGAPGNGTAWEEESGGDCGLRVIRGGSWVYAPKAVRSSFRDWSFLDDRGIDGVGFRLVQDL